MSAFTNDFEDLDVQRLVEQDLLEEGRACGRKFYTVRPAGREFLGQKLKVDPGLGEIGEKTPHKVGVELLELWLDSRDDVAQVDPYAEPVGVDATSLAPGVCLGEGCSGRTALRYTRPSDSIC